MRSITRRFAALAAVGGLVVGAAGVANADTVVNDVPVVANVKVATITSGDTGLVVKYKITHPDDPADAPECDAKINGDGGQPVVVTPWVPLGVSTSSSTVRFETNAECQNGVEKSLTFTSSTPGTYAITHAISWTTRGGTRSMDNEANFTLNVLPRAASDLEATAGDAKVDLSWTASPDSASIDGYKVYQGTSTTPVATVTGTTASITGLANGTQYCFVVKAYKVALESAASNSACATPVAPVTYAGQFLRPVDGNGTINIVKQGRVVPVKIEITNGGDEVKTGEVTFTQRRTGSCNSATPSDPVEETAGSSNTGNAFRFVVEDGADYWQYNLNTRNLTLGCTTFDIWHDGARVTSFILNTTK